MHFQKRTKGGKKRLYSGVIHLINRKVEFAAKKFDCSKSFVVNTLLGEALGIPLDEKFYEINKTTRKTGTQVNMRKQRGNGKVR